MAYSFLGNQMFDKILTMNVPTLAVFNGHSIAGGVFLGLCHDRIIMKDDPKLYLSLNELNIGIPFCHGMAAIPKQVLSSSSARHLIMGDKIPPIEALKMDIAKELYSGNEDLEKKI